MAIPLSVSEQKLLDAARRCDNVTLENIVRADKTNLNVTDQVNVTLENIVRIGKTNLNVADQLLKFYMRQVPPFASDWLRACQVNVTLGYLVRAGKTTLNLADEGGCTAVHLCCKSADLSSLALLLEHGAKSNLYDKNGHAPFHHAAQKDFIETMSVLVSYGADVNIQTQHSLQTPLHLAATGNKTRTVKFLMFCGADPNILDKDHKVAAIRLTKEEQTSHSCLRDSYRKGKTKTAGKMIRRNETHVFKNIDLKIENTDKDSKTFSFLCRKTALDLKHTDTNSREIISDYYEYLVSQVVDHIPVTVYIHTKPTKYDDIKAKDSTGQEFKCVSMLVSNEGTFCTFDMTLRGYEDNIYSFYVYVETTTSSFVTKGGAETLQSTIDGRFKLEIPTGCLPKNTFVGMQVLPIMQSYLGGLNTEYVHNVSNFCNVQLSARTRRPLSLSMPLPTETKIEDIHERKDTEIVVFHCHEETQTPTEWTEVQSSVNVGNETVLVKETNVSHGTCIVTKVPKKRKSGFKDWVKHFLGWMFNTASNRMKPCCFYALTKQCSESSYRLLIGLADDGLVDEIVKKWTHEQYATQLSQKRGGYLLKPNCKIMARLDNHDIKINGSAEFVIMFRSGQEVFEEFMLDANEHECAVVLLHKVLKQSSATMHAEIDSNCITQINVELLTNIDKPSRELSHIFTEFPDSQFLTWLARQLGHQWMMVGVGLGLNSTYLETIEKGNTAERAILTMLYTWRGESDHLPDLGLTTLIHSLTIIDRKDVITNVNKQVSNILKAKPEARVGSWVRQLTEGVDDIDGPSVSTDTTDAPDEDLCISCLIDDQEAVSPFTEQFLLCVVSFVRSNLTLLALLGLPLSTVEEVRHTIKDPVASMFKCLLLAHRKYRDVVEFYDDLLTALQQEQNRKCIFEIKREIKQWINKQATSTRQTDNDVRKLIATINKF